ncbi:hypothetical protein E2C01_007386 [Portunus trituberculatus]|uniref:Uncharacterized protein n=1 Tax=Portunus trituberculatus TaxID=210409 RepID=A0A5B7CZC2_PORTR|nr:hypothetical protein [Portunus trituberculatus]
MWLPVPRSMTGKFYSVSSASLVEEGGDVEEDVRPVDPEGTSTPGSWWSSDVVGSDDGTDLARSSNEPVMEHSTSTLDRA